MFRDRKGIDFSTYPWNIPAVRDIKHLRFHADVTFLVGENGSGKSTVLEAIALALGYVAEGGTRNARFQTVESVFDNDPVDQFTALGSQIRRDQPMPSFHGKRQGAFPEGGIFEDGKHGERIL